MAHCAIEYRSASQAIVVSSNWICCFVGLILFPLAQRALNQYIFLIFVGSLAAGWVLTYYLMPESKGKTPQEMRVIFGGPVKYYRNAHKMIEKGTYPFPKNVDSLSS